MASLEPPKKRLIMGISGASGMLYAIRFIKSIPNDIELHVIVSDIARRVMKMETGWDIENTVFSEYYADKYGQIVDDPTMVFHGPMDHFAPIASGSFQTVGMIVMPCSAKTLSGIANGYAHTLLERAADVCLKEGRKLILVFREAPYNNIHIKNMLSVSNAGGIVLPASPAFYHHPKTVEDMVDFVVARALDQLNIPHRLVKPWGEIKND
jgi:4-hydroxy-3-polyprenylbenzoate decarboxylase